MVTLFSGNSTPDRCASVTPWLVELKVAFSVFSYSFVKCEIFFLKALDDLLSLKQMD